MPFTTFFAKSVSATYMLRKVSSSIYSGVVGGFRCHQKQNLNALSAEGANKRPSDVGRRKCITFTYPAPLYDMESRGINFATYGILWKTRKLSETRGIFRNIGREDVETSGMPLRGANTVCAPAYEPKPALSLSVIRGARTLFAAADVCQELGIKNTSDAVSKNLDDDDRGIASIYTPSGD